MTLETKPTGTSRQAPYDALGPKRVLEAEGEPGRDGMEMRSQDTPTCDN